MAVAREIVRQRPRGADHGDHTNSCNRHGGFGRWPIGAIDPEPTFVLPGSSRSTQSFPALQGLVAQRQATKMERA